MPPRMPPMAPAEYEPVLDRRKHVMTITIMFDDPVSEAKALRKVKDTLTSMILLSDSDDTPFAQIKSVKS
jgi:hypothetical protein